MKDLDDIIRQLSSLSTYIKQLDDQFADQGRVVYGGPVLWEDEKDARFEADNPEIINSIRIISQDIHRIFKG